MDTGVQAPLEISVKEITSETDTRDILEHARQQGEIRNFENVFICDIDSHHVETESWGDLAQYIEDEVLRFQAIDHLKNRTGSPPYGLNGDLGLRFQDCGGRIIHQGKRGEKVEDKTVHRDVVLAQRAYETMAIDFTVVFPTQMLNLGVHPQFHMEAPLSSAYNRWFTEQILASDKNLGSMIYLPFGDPELAMKIVEEYADNESVIGYMVTSVRQKPVHHNQFMKLYGLVQEVGKPLGFHAGYYWNDEWMSQVNQFGAMHALSFVWCNVVHMTNWVWNGLSEKFPDLKTIWIESGLAWVPWLMQRLDHTYLMRTSEAPLLKRLPSEYMREMFYTSQPLETDHQKGLETTFDMIDAPNSLLYASDWPHWDFDTPGVIWDMPFLSEEDKRKILGLNAAKLFGLKVPENKLGVAAAAE
ncbi:MAG: amidohydrolase family protein [Pseudomonadota bacterium]|nr:amidohydrolase family protein [Pseudomonadota bacterium]